ncbi:hypothetical protein DFA_03771 [Cavenderia fasciculata]|uniref:ER membrane protein complex subunit 2 n=1 Tax=Cavenderia fasciculata TaxID=261658 RepID=F4Q0C6_CACFS|nr:uncharacterized protein DFA_03771 [Cavenderia fasciculata]EGG18277.1 hypothetical protein DFA_03771 [Cavenderia fasciculata]|eukprot:XP_004357100.1 hypothetical protein DFA_03771 [Cavenderia fasciculata]
MDINQSEVAQLKEYREKVYKKSFDAKLVIEFLRFLRITKLRSTRLVADLGSTLLSKYFSKITTENEVTNTFSVCVAYDIVEQVVLALLECNKAKEASEFIEDRLVKKFGEKSVRVSRLRAMQLECSNTFGKANDIYVGVLEKYPADQLTMKRQVSILKSKGQYQQAITMLNTYLQAFMIDPEAWLELAHLNIKLLSFKNAMFCYEELILAAPINYIYYVKYAELIYSIGGAENYIVALKYYTHSLELNNHTSQDNAIPPTNLTALYGIIMCIFSFCNTHGYGTTKLREPQIELYQWCQSELRAITAKYTPHKLSIVNAFIQHTDVLNK